MSKTSPTPQTAKKTDKSGATVPSSYSLKRTFSPSEFLFYEATPEAANRLLTALDVDKAVAALDPVVVTPGSGYRGTFSQFQDGKNREDFNVGTMDTAHLSAECDTLVVKGVLSVLPQFKAPHSSNSPSFEREHREFVGYALSAHPEWLRDLARAYAENIAEGVIIWDNADGLPVDVRVDVPTRDVPIVLTEGKHDPRFEELVEELHAALLSTKRTNFTIVVMAELGRGQPVYPSQPFLDENSKAAYLRNRDSEQRKDYGRVLSSRRTPKGQLQAVLSSQKVGNGLRKVDVWYAEDAPYGAVALEAFGSVPSRGVALREKGTNSLYDYFNPNMQTFKDDEFVVKYVLGMLIKGGLFGQKEKSAGEGAENSEKASDA